MATITVNLNLTTSSVAEGSNLYFTQSRVRSTPLSGLNITGSSLADTDTVIQAFGKLQNQINGLLGGAIYQGTWNATTNSPTLASATGTKGHYYVVSVAGSTNLDGVTDWKVGDWAIYNGVAWQKVDNTDAVTSVNGYIGAVSLTTDDIDEGVNNLYFADDRAIDAIVNVLGGSDTIEFNYGGGQITADVLYQMSIDSDMNGLRLLNDEESPGANHFYGTDGTGTKGWQPSIIYNGGTGITINESGDISISNTYVGQTSITTLGTITTGTWQGTAIAANKGGTGLTSYAVGDLLYADTTSSLNKLAAVAVGSMLISNGVTTAPSWSTAGRLTTLSLNSAAFTTTSPLMVTASGNLRDNSWNTAIEIQSTVSNAFPALIFGNQTGSTRTAAIFWTRSTSGNTGNLRQVQITGYEVGSVGVMDFSANNNIGTATGGVMLKIYGTTGLYIGASTVPTALLHIKAGTASASTAPLKFTSGTNMTTAEAGAMEYNNTPHFTNSDATRRHIVLAPNTTKVTAAAPYANDGYIVLNIGGTDFKVMTTA